MSPLAGLGTPFATLFPTAGSPWAKGCRHWRGSDFARCVYPRAYGAEGCWAAIGEVINPELECGPAPLRDRFCVWGLLDPLLKSSLR